MIRQSGGFKTAWLAASLCLVSFSAPAQERSYRLPDLGNKLKERVIWGSECEGDEGFALAFGGQDQQGDDGHPHTRVRVGGEWKAIHEELRSRNPLQDSRDQAVRLAKGQAGRLARARAKYLSGKGSAKDLAGKTAAEAVDLQHLDGVLNKLEDRLIAESRNLPKPAGQQAQRAIRLISGVAFRCAALKQKPGEGITPELLHDLWTMQVDLELAAEALDAEPPPRALSPLVYDAKSKQFYLFGGDHLDYLTNDLWAFDPERRAWRHLHAEGAPPPRANHKFAVSAEGKLTLSGGYTYTSNTGYTSGQYKDLADGEWTFDLAAGKWSGEGKLVSPAMRVYREGPFHPDFYLAGPAPDANETKTRLADLKPNTWLKLNPPHLPRLNRDWGTAVLDPDHDVILRFSGGHSAHGGSDVLHYHLGTSRWELPFPVEFPLGQLYSNTSYPEGFNLNQRPWVTGHTYQNYGYDTRTRRMLFTGQSQDCFLYDPGIGEWTGRLRKPAGMIYNSCFYTLTVCGTADNVFCWTERGEVFRYAVEEGEHSGVWEKLTLSGEKLPGAVVDNSTVVYDSRRDRLLFFHKGYGKERPYDGRLHALALKSGEVTQLTPDGAAALGASSPYLCQLRYDAARDLLLVGGTLAPGEDGLRRTPAYDCAGNRWLSLAIGGDDPSGPQGRNVSLGLMYDARRDLFWAVDTNSQVFALRLDMKTADAKGL